MARHRRRVPGQRPRRIVLEHEQQLVAPLQAPVEAGVAARRGAAHVQHLRARLVAGRPAAQARAKAPVDVLQVRDEVAVEEADVLECGHPVHGGAAARAEHLARLVVPAVVRLAVAAARRRARPLQRVAGAVQPPRVARAAHLADDGRRARVRVEDRDEPRQVVGRELEVVVEQREVLGAGRELDRAVERSRHAEVLRVAHDLQPAERVRRPLGRAVGRAVVEQDVARTVEVLRGERGQHPLEQVAAVEVQHHGGQAGGAHRRRRLETRSAAPRREPSHHAAARPRRRSTVNAAARAAPEAASASPSTARSPRGRCTSA